MSEKSPSPSVAILMGSKSDWSTMSATCRTLDELGVAYEARVISAHRAPDRLIAYCREAEDRGFKVMIAGAGMAAALPGMVAALTPLPVLGVPVESKSLKGLDSLLSMVQMPGGVPVATFAIGTAGAVNAAIFAATILGLGDADIAAALARRRAEHANASSEVPSD